MQVRYNSAMNSITAEFGKDFMKELIRLWIILFTLASYSAGAAASSEVSLDGLWSFAPDPAATFKIGDLPSGSIVRPINVPGSWQAQFPDLRDYAGVSWYWRTIHVKIPTRTRIAV